MCSRLAGRQGSPAVSVEKHFETVLGAFLPGWMQLTQACPGRLQASRQVPRLQLIKVCCCATMMRRQFHRSLILLYRLAMLALPGATIKYIMIGVCARERPRKWLKDIFFTMTKAAYARAGAQASQCTSLDCQPGSSTDRAVSLRQAAKSVEPSTARIGTDALDCLHLAGS